MKYISPYPFSKELPKTLTFADLNFTHPLIRPFVKAYIGVTKLSVKAMRAPKFRIGPINCYKVEPSGKETLPAILYLHGGGFMFPLQPMMFWNARYYAQRCRCRVFLPEYRYAPKFPFPVPFEDCVNTYRYIYENADRLHVDCDRIILYGDSAGGALAAAVCQKLRDDGLPLPAAQMLMYPVTDNDPGYQSLDAYALGTWSKDSNRQMWEIYLKNGDCGMLSYAAPMQASSLRGLPQSYVEIAEMDCLADQGIAYAERLKNDGVTTTVRIVKGAYHGYDGHPKSPLVQRELQARADYINQIFGGTKYGAE